VDPATISQVESGKRRPHLETLDSLAEAMGVEVADFFPKSEPSLFDNGEQRRRPEGIQALQDQIMARASMYGDEAEDESSPHFQNATAAALWLERVQNEMAMWTDFSLKQVGPFLPRRRFSGWKAIGDVATWGSWFDAAVRDGERRIASMRDKPDDLAARRLEKAKTAGQEARERLEELRIVNG
jgi:transcriptional regulator with XRE-family HTH domain